MLTTTENNNNNDNSYFGHTDSNIIKLMEKTNQILIHLFGELLPPQSDQIILNTSLLYRTTLDQ
ncbi:hypothetical protein DERP_008195 [Dermatophagoides pteronyssinus]|uniref:Uncharacterized protein n=1 Tax=Dermatophagoides pteronyssinus TaxID=6956 RepID=A0ABQ8JJZ0_DERPT|nr:hypothetical protein DERP_008195 [Dermatophagoides pteronyssinus]